MQDGEQQLRNQQMGFAAHLRAPDRHSAPPAIEDRRMQIYRDLFINNVTGFLANSFPVLSDLLGKDRWGMLIRDFYRDHQSHSPLFPDLPKEFLDYLVNERENGEQTDIEADPPFLYELAHYEWVETGLALAEEPDIAPGIVADVDLLDGQLCVYPLAWLFSYNYPVNEISREQQPAAPEAQPLHFLVYRNAELKVKFIKLNIISARLFELLSSPEPTTGRRALETIADELNHSDPGRVVESGQTILAQWRDLGILLGSR